MRKSKKIIIGMFIVAFLFFVASIVITMINTRSVRYKDVVYCSNGGMCYTYDGLYLKHYEDEDETEGSYLDYLVSKCIYTSFLNTCEENIIAWDKDKMYMKNEYKGNSYIYGYYNVEIPRSDTKKIDLSNKAYNNNELDLFFCDNNYVIVSGPNKTQERCSYSIEAYDFDDYTTVRYECLNKVYDKDNIRNSYTYDLKKDEIMGFKKTTKDKLSNINYSYYNNDYKYILNDSLYKNGHYKIKADKNTTNVEEIWINKNKITIKQQLLEKDDYLVETYDLDIREYNDKYILYNYRSNSHTLYYDLEKETLCIYGACYEKID